MVSYKSANVVNYAVTKDAINIVKESDMNIDISATNFELTEAIKNHVIGKFTRLENHAKNLSYLHVILKKEKRDFVAEAILNLDHHNDIIVSTSLSDLYKAIDSTYERVKGKLDRVLERDHKHH